MVGNLGNEQIKDLLAAQRFAHLGCYADNQMYIVPISYALDGDNLVGQTTPGRKVEMMRKNPEVCLQVEDIRAIAHWKSAILWGRFEELSGVEAGHAMGLLIDRYGAIFEDEETEERRGRDIAPPRLDKQPSTVVVYRILVREMSGRFEEPDA